MKGERWWDPKGKLFWQIVMTICAWGFIVALHLDNDGLWPQGDAPRHAANGAFWSDFLARLPAAPRDFAFAYYARYPVISPTSYPPAFYLLEAAAYQVLGVSAFIAKGLVLATILLGAIYLVAWLRRWVSEDAGWAGSLFVLQPSTIVFGDAVMLNVPSMVLGVAALYHWRRWLEAPASRQLYAAAALATLAVLTYLSVAVVPVVMLAWCVWGARWDVFRQRRLWIVAGAAAITIGVWVLLTMRWDPHWATGASTGASTGPSDWPVVWKMTAWGFYARHLPGFVTIPVVVLAAAGLGLGLVDRTSRREVAFLSLWIVLAYVWFTAISLTIYKGISLGDMRYVMLLVPPIILLAAIGVENGLRLLVVGARGARAEWPRLMPWVAVLALHVWLAAAVSVPRVSGFREIVRFVGEVAPSERVFYDGAYDGVFSFYTLAADAGFRRGVVLGKKLLYATKILPSFGLVEIAASPGSVRESLRFRCGCRILVIERQIAPELKRNAAAANLREVVAREPARLIRSFRVEADSVTDVDVYEWRSVDSVPSTIDLPFPSLNNVRVQVKPLQY